MFDNLQESNNNQSNQNPEIVPTPLSSSSQQPGPTSNINQRIDKLVEQGASKGKSKIAYALIGAGVLILIIGGGAYAGYTYWPQITNLIGLEKKETACPADAKLCPDGSSVGRVAPDCEFAECPEVVEEECAEEGEQIGAEGMPRKCCEGLVNKKFYKDSDCSLIASLDNINNCEDVCGSNESDCNCKEKIIDIITNNAEITLPEDMLSLLVEGLEDAPEEGLIELNEAIANFNKALIENYNSDSNICVDCGDGECGLGENKCNCPEDCGVDTSDWEIYRNEEYGFEFKYPKNLNLSEENKPNCGNYSGINYKIFDSKRYRDFNIHRWSKDEFIDACPDAGTFYRDISYENWKYINENLDNLKDGKCSQEVLKNMPGETIADSSKECNVKLEDSYIFIETENNFELFSDNVVMDWEYKSKFSKEELDQVYKIISTIKFFKPVDSDNDGLADEDEAIYGADTNNPDTDGDGYQDGLEVRNGYNPNGSGKL